jgi:hypothetical protein
MDEKERNGNPRIKYEKPEAQRLAATKACGDCAGGSGDENCYPTGNSATFMCMAGNSA